MGNFLYLFGTLVQVVAYTNYRVSMTVACLAGVAYWLALLFAWKTGAIR